MRFSLALMVAVLLTLAASSAGAVDNFEPLEDGTHYIWASVGNLWLSGLNVTSEYCVLVASNFDSTDQQWVNFTAESTLAQVSFVQQYYSGGEEDRPAQLGVSLYLSDTLLHTTYLPIVWPSDQIMLDTYFEMFTTLLTLVVVLFLLASLGRWGRR